MAKLRRQKYIYTLAIVILLMDVFGATAAVTGSFPWSPTLVEPLVLTSDQSVWSVTLAIRAALYDDGISRLWSRQYCIDLEAFDSPNITRSNSYASAAASARGGWHCSFPGPTIVFKAGDRVALSVRNDLTATDIDISSDPATNSNLTQQQQGRSDAPATSTNGMRRMVNFTNLHVHGMHVSTVVDSVFVRIAPGATHTYNFIIPIDHAPGIGLYHAHLHGLTALQVMGGLHGAFLVRPPLADASAKQAPAPLPTSYLSLPATMLVISHIQLLPDRDAITGIVTQECDWTTLAPYDMFKSHSFSELAEELGDRLFSQEQTQSNNATKSDGTLDTGNYYVVNGQVQPMIEVTARRWHVLQFVHAGGARTIDVEAPAGCVMEVLAVDGVFLNKIGLRRLLHLLPAARYEVQIRCDEPGEYAVPSRFYRFRQTLFILRAVMELTQAQPTMPAFNHSEIGVSSSDLASLPRPYYLKDLSASSSESVWTNSVSFAFPDERNLTCFGAPRFLGSGPECGAVWRGEVLPSRDPSVWSTAQQKFIPNPCTFAAWPGNNMSISGSEPSPNVRSPSFVAPINSLAEWRIYGMMERQSAAASAGSSNSSGMSSMLSGPEVIEYHPYHIHAHHMQVLAFTLSFPGATAADEAALLEEHFLEPGTWRDTFATLDGELLVRFRVMPEPGEVIMHCHTLRHEDHGMMASWFATGDGSNFTATGLDERSTTSASFGRTDISAMTIGAITGLLTIIIFIVIACLYRKRQQQRRYHIVSTQLSV